MTNGWMGIEEKRIGSELKQQRMGRGERVRHSILHIVPRIYSRSPLIRGKFPFFSLKYGPIAPSEVSNNTRISEEDFDRELKETANGNGEFL
jgi:hypothetical protein